MSSSLIAKISRRWSSTVQSYRSDRRFSNYYAMLRVFDELGGRLHFRNVSAKAHEKKDEWMLHYLSEVLEPVLKQYESVDYDGEQSADAPIWVFWWTGEHNAPALVQRCIRSIRENAGQHPVNVLSQNNLSDYLDIPDYIREKVATKEMGLAHFADYVRARLLYQYGGLWLDSTIFCSGKIPDSYFSHSFFTCKSEPQACGYISAYRWCTFCMGAWKHNLFMEYLVKAFERYWSTQPCAIDYLFFDYIILLGYNRIPAIQRMVDEVPFNNIHRDDLQAAMNAALPAKVFNSILQMDTTLYKLSWRENYAEISADGTPSIYSTFLTM